MSAEFVKLDGSVLVNVANFDELINLAVIRTLTKFAKNRFQFSGTDVSIFVFVVHIKGFLEGRAFHFRYRPLCLRGGRYTQLRLGALLIHLQIHNII